MILLREWDSVGPVHGSPTRGMHLDASSAGAVARLNKLQRLVIRDLRDGLEVDSLSWVGRIRIGAVEISIVPKLAAETLLGLFRYAYGLADIELHEDVRLDEGTLSIPDLLIAQLSREADALLARGLHRRYMRRTEVLGAPRGRIAVSELARGPLLSAALVCTHHPRDVEWDVNRIVRGGLELAVGLAGSKRLAHLVASSARAWAHHVSSMTLDLRRVRAARAGLDRMTDRYDSALALIEMILESIEIGIDGTSEVTRLPGFLFDMNKFFERLVTRYLRDHLEGVEVREQVQLRTLFSYSRSANPHRRHAPVPKPDIELRVGHAPGVFLDAKYRDLWRTKLPREMLYQLAVYAVASTGGSTAILYPTDDASARESVIEMRDGSTPRSIALRPIILPQLLDTLKTRGGREAATRLAAEMAFGAGYGEASSSTSPLTGALR
jgi:5-methylcytosine-specific restriction enzyme subunit McrC